MDQVPWRPIKNGSGFLLIELMIGSAFIVVVILSIMALGLRSNLQSRDASAANQLEHFKETLVHLARNNSAWTKTIAVNPTLQSCLNGTTACNAAHVGEANARDFILTDAAGVTFYDSTDARNGVTAQGIPCGPGATKAPFNSAAFYYDPVNINPRCPFRFNLRWYAMRPVIKPVIAIYALIQLPDPASAYSKKPEHLLAHSLDLNRYSIGNCQNAPTYSGGNVSCSPINNPLMRITQ